MKKLIALTSLIFINSYSTQKKIENYNFTPDAIDVVIPCHEKDTRSLELAIKGITENGIGLRRIIVISDKQLSKNAEWSPESIFPFTKKDLALAIAHGDELAAKDVMESGRIGWIYQQFLKFYAPFVIENISPNVLVLDADTIFLNKVEFMNKSGEPYFNVGGEYYETYFEHAIKLLDEPDTIKKVFNNYSGVCHHMLFQRPVLEDLFKKVEKKSGKIFWEALCLNVDINTIRKSCLSEYEIYFNFIMAHTTKAKVRLLKWTEIAFKNGVEEQYRKMEYHYISCHSYMN